MFDKPELGRGGLWRDAFRRLRNQTSVIVAFGILVTLLIAAWAGPWLSSYELDAIDWDHMTVAPSLSDSHWLGTDRLGRDLALRTMIGLRISLAIGLLAALVSVVIGALWGAIAGYVGGRVDGFLMRTVDVLYALPYIFFVIILATMFERGNVAVLFIAIGAVGWLTTARVVRGQTVVLREREFVEAARALGASTPRILVHHVLPNLTGTLAVFATLAIPQMILYESFLSFLGLGVQEPLASLGTLINEGARDMESAPWLLLVPATALVSTIVCFNVIGDGLRDALDPRSR